MEEEIKNAISELFYCYRHFGETRKNNLNCYRHDIFEKWEITDLNTTPQYTWQWNLTVLEYEDIKKVLKKCAAVLKEVIQQNKICCKLLQLYISEWYKREYNGGDKQGNAFGSIGLTNISEIICRKLDIDENVVYHDSSGDCRWRDTLYVDGGLPLNYLLNNNNTGFRRTIEDIIESSAEGIEYLSDDLGDLCNNQIVNQSYKARILFPDEEEASIYDFIQEYVIKGNLEIEGFEEFTKLVREKNDNALQKKFEIRYKVFKTDSDFQLIPQLFLKSEPNGVRYSISQERLKAWRISPENDRIHIEIVSKDKSIWKRVFYKCLRGDYIISSKNDLFDLWLDSNSYCLDKWQVLVDGKTVTSLALKNILQEQGFVQLYSKNGYSWSSQSNGYKFSSVLYIRNQDISLNDDNDTKIVIHGEELPWGWKQIKDKLQFTIRGGSITLYEKAGVLEVLPKEKHTLTEFLNTNQNQKNLILLNEKEKPTFEVILTKTGIRGEPIPDAINESQLQWRYRRSTTENFAEWRDNSCFETGFFQCKVTLKSNDRISKTIDCFALPKQAEINNNPDNKRTDFRGFGGLMVSVHNEVLNDDNGIRRKFWQNEINYHNPYATYTISDGNESFDIIYPQPVEAVVLKKKTNGVLFDVGSNNKGFRLPICVIDKLEAFKLPENNKIEISRYDKIQRAFLDLKEYRFNQTINQTDIPYVTFKTFTHTEFKWNNGKPYINRGNLDFSDLTFVFSPVDNPRELVPIPLISDDDRTCYFDVKGFPEGIIMQQVGKYDISKNFIRPFYIPNLESIENLNEQDRKDRRLSRIDKCHKSYLSNNADRFDEALAYFELASKTGNYFGSFDALMGLVCHYDENIKNTRWRN